MCGLRSNCPVCYAIRYSESIPPVTQSTLTARVRWSVASLWVVLQDHCQDPLSSQERVVECNLLLFKKILEHERKGC